MLPLPVEVSHRQLLAGWTAMSILELPLEVNDLGPLSHAEYGNAILEALAYWSEPLHVMF